MTFDTEDDAFEYWIEEEYFKLHYESSIEDMFKHWLEEECIVWQS